jgi:hypothetical protein
MVRPTPNSNDPKIANFNRRKSTSFTYSHDRTAILRLRHFQVNKVRQVLNANSRTHHRKWRTLRPQLSSH